MNDFKYDVLELIDSFREDVRDMRENGETDIRTVIAMIDGLHREVSDLNIPREFISGGYISGEKLETLHKDEVVLTNEQTKKLIDDSGIEELLEYIDNIIDKKVSEKLKLQGLSEQITKSLRSKGVRR